MANITGQQGTPNVNTDFEFYLQNNEARYDDDSGTPTTIQGVTIRMEDPLSTAATPPFWRSAFTTPSLSSDSNASRFEAENAFINFTSQVPLNNQGQGTWSGGAIQIRNSTINYSGGVRQNGAAVTGIQWPGYIRVGTGSATSIAEINQRYTIDLQDSTILCTRGGLWTFHFQGGALTGHNLTGLTLGEGVVPFALFAQNDWINVTFSPSSIGSNTATNDVNFRFEQPGGGTISAITTGIWDQRWNVFAGCDFSGWNDPNATNFTSNVNAANRFTWNLNTNTGDLPQVWVIDGTFSNEITQNGFTFQTGNAGAARSNFY